MRGMYVLKKAPLIFLQVLSKKITRNPFFNIQYYDQGKTGKECFTL